MFQLLNYEYFLYIFAFIIGVSIGGGIELLSLGLPSIRFQQNHRNKMLLFTSIFLLIIGSILFFTGFALFVMVLINKLNVAKGHSEGGLILFILITFLTSFLLFLPVLIKMIKK